MGGKNVQMVQGEKKARGVDKIEERIGRFSDFSLVQLIDLDAAIGSSSNARLIEMFVNRLPCQVGGGIRSVEVARQMLEAGARRVILGSSLIRDGQINLAFAQQMANELGPEKLVF